MRIEITRRRHGIRRIAGTDFPVESVLTQEGPQLYRVTYYLCNGVPNSAIDYPSRIQAFDALQEAYRADHTICTAAQPYTRSAPRAPRSVQALHPVRDVAHPDATYTVEDCDQGGLDFCYTCPHCGEQWTVDGPDA